MIDFFLKDRCAWFWKEGEKTKQYFLCNKHVGIYRQRNKSIKNVLSFLKILLKLF